MNELIIIGRIFAASGVILMCGTYAWICLLNGEFLLGALFAALAFIGGYKLMLEDALHDLDEAEDDGE